MTVDQLPSLLQSALASNTLDAIRTARYALAAPILQLQGSQRAQLQQAAATLLASKPITQWSPADHATFMQASGDHHLDVSTETKPMGETSPPGARRQTRARDPEIPF